MEFDFVLFIITLTGLSLLFYLVSLLVQKRTFKIKKPLEDLEGDEEDGS